ncbi:MAG: hypothetical protein ABSB70_22515 [Candidatus Velthaea sp.]
MNSQGVARVLRATRCLIALGALTFVQQTPAPPSAADALFARAVAVVENDARSPYATYTVVVTVANEGRRAVSSWQTTEDIRHEVVLASSFSEEERANPTTPHGANIVAHRRLWLSAPRNLNPSLDPSTSLTLNSHPVNAERTGDEVGPVALAVDQNFGLTRPRAYRVANDERTIVASADELQIIGRTGTAAPRYRVAMLDTGGGVAHLGLTPLRDPYRNRLRELWMDTQTAYVRDAIVQGVGDRAPFDRARWHVTFDRQAGATFVSEAHSVEPLAIGHTSPQISIAFQNLNLLSLSPIRATFGIEAPVRYLRDP